MRNRQCLCSLARFAYRAWNCLRCPKERDSCPNRPQTATNFGLSLPPVRGGASLRSVLRHNFDSWYRWLSGGSVVWSRCRNGIPFPSGGCWLRFVAPSAELGSKSNAATSTNQRCSMKTIDNSALTKAAIYRYAIENSAGPSKGVYRGV
jgi:hypothetical protein